MSESFQAHFEMLPAVSRELKQAAFRLRYEVFCLELEYWNQEEFPNGLEIDEYDEIAEHYVIRHRRSGEVAATTRLILPDLYEPERPFPIETHSRVDYANLLEGVPRTKIAEVSRFCVSPHYKRRLGEKHTLVGESAPSNYQPSMEVDGERRSLPFFMITLICCLLRMSIHHEISHWLAFMEPALTRALRTMGICFVPIGPLVDYCGKRGPYLIEIEKLLDGTKEKNLIVWKMLTNNGQFWDDGDYSEWVIRQAGTLSAKDYHKTN
jgi:N-acyl amino acid synthase of PEP-CTERM/exosortase system